MLVYFCAIFISLTSYAECLTVEQAYGVFKFLFQYAIPVSVFAFCYGSIFCTIRRQRNIIAGHEGYGKNFAMATTSRDPNTGQVQQQGPGASTTSAPKLSRTEMNVLKTVIPIIICYLVAFSPYRISEFLEFLGVSN